MDSPDGGEEAPEHVKSVHPPYHPPRCTSQEICCISRPTDQIKNPMAPSRSPLAASNARMASSRLNPSSMILAIESCGHRDDEGGAGRVLAPGFDADAALEDAVAPLGPCRPPA